MMLGCGPVSPSPSSFNLKIYHISSHIQLFTHSIGTADVVPRTTMRKRSMLSQRSGRPFLHPSFHLFVHGGRL